ncbi:glycosylation-dependent cell adhesion molecule 1-like [Zalophus californianus]|uniref:Glycosylation-dependent cell adhesion molecule 1 n=1 Tax=Zalophus californianus TaxID=9704 RepID=A0A6J2CVH5_ZALCA|nr:glycosylation-dependent cell adhesion molecule 1-like [Zalophus californianus]
MKCFPILLLVSLASTSLAILNEQEDEIHLEPQPIHAPTQLIPEKNHVSIENSSEETPISSEELGFEEEDVIKSTRRPKSQKLELLHPIPQEASFRNAAPQSEETTELTLRAERSQATTPEGTLAKLGHKIGKNLDKTVKETVNYLKSLLPHAYEVTRP